jgi:hypothetical protein
MSFTGPNHGHSRQEQVILPLKGGETTRLVDGRTTLPGMGTAQAMTKLTSENRCGQLHAGRSSQNRYSDSELTNGRFGAASVGDGE